MKDLLCEAGQNFSSSAELEIVRDIKEKKCYVALDFDAEMKAFEEGNSKETEYELPDGSSFKFGSQQIRCPEALFNPSVLGKDFGGVHQASYQCIQQCDIDLRRELFGNIALSGGTTCFPGINDRLGKDVAGLAPSNVKV